MATIAMAFFFLPRYLRGAFTTLLNFSPIALMMTSGGSVSLCFCWVTAW